MAASTTTEAEQRRQRALESLAILDTAPDERVDRVTRLAQDIFGVPMVSVTLIDRDRQWRKSEIGLGTREAPREDSFCAATVSQDSPLIVEDASVSESFRANPFVVADPHLRFYAGHPLRAPGGEPIGTLCVLDTEPRRFGPDERALLGDLALWVQTELARSHDAEHAVVMQRALAPRLPAPVDGWTVHAGFLPHSGLSGDFYDVAVADGTLSIALGDVMGKGTGPALVAAAVRGSLRTAPERTPERALAEVDALLRADLQDATVFVTAVDAQIDLATGALVLADAGHSLAGIHRADGTWEHLRSNGLPLGMDVAWGMTREQIVARLDPGDTFVCCSDGVLDLLDPDDPAGHATRVLTSAGPQGAIDEALRSAREQAVTDDVTVLAVRRDA